LKVLKKLHIDSGTQIKEQLGNKDGMKVTKMVIKERKWQEQAKKECQERRDREVICDLKLVLMQKFKLSSFMERHEIGELQILRTKRNL
jgi:hypothetical protein